MNFRTIYLYSNGITRYEDEERKDRYFHRFGGAFAPGLQGGRLDAAVEKPGHREFPGEGTTGRLADDCCPAPEGRPAGNRVEADPWKIASPTSGGIFCFKRNKNTLSGHPVAIERAS